MKAVGKEHALVTAQVAFTPVPVAAAAPRSTVKCQYGAGRAWVDVPGRDKFELFVDPTQRRAGRAGERVDGRPGHPIQRIGDTAWPLDQIARFELRRADGEPLLVYNLT